MKNCDEMVNSLLERREQYSFEQMNKKKRIIRAATSLGCVCLIVLLGFGVWQGSWLKPSSNQTINDAVYPGIHDTFDERKGQNTDSPAVNNQISIQEVDELPNPTHALFALMADDFIPMSRDEINQYYTIDIFPTVPNDLQESEGEAFGIYRREKGTGELYWDSNEITYFSKDHSKYLYVGVDKDCIPFDFCNLFKDTQSKSLINQVQVGIAQTKNGEYYAEFMYHNVGFRVIGKGVSQDEFIAIIASILE